MILKAGTYRFNNVISGNGIPFGGVDYDYTLNFPFISNDTQLNIIWFLGSPSDNDFVFMAYAPELSEESLIVAYSPEDGGWSDIEYRVITIPEDTEVDDTFGTWYIENTNYNEVNAKPLAEITYNGETIAQLNAGETCTLKCAGLPMKTDIIIKINEVN